MNKSKSHLWQNTKQKTLQINIAASLLYPFYFILYPFFSSFGFPGTGTV